MIRKIFTDFPKEKFTLQIDKEKINKIISYLREAFGFVEIKFYSRKK